MTKTLRLAALFAVALVVTAGLSPIMAGDFKSEGVARLSAIETKFVGLAEAMPADKYTWRPEEGVRSISEVYMHVTGANYGIPGRLGTPPPEGFSFQGYDTSTTDKAEIVKAMKASFAHAKGAIENIPAGDADKAVKMFGTETTMRGAVLFMLEHLSEHMGQSIAYARVNDVKPPWAKE